MSTKNPLHRICATLLAIACVCTLQAVSTAAPGKSHSYKLKDGVLVTFTYQDDGQKVLDLSDGKYNAYYTIECSTNLSDWSVLAMLRLSNRGSAAFIDTSSFPLCFYRVNPAQ
jgi:hypothetical protein